MIKPEDKVLSSLSTLNSSTEFKIFLDWLRQSLEESDKNNRHLDGPVLYRGQGEALVLAHLLETAAKANQVLSTRKHNERKRQDRQPGFL